MPAAWACSAYAVLWHCIAAGFRVGWDYSDMQIIKENYKFDPRADVYWGRIFFRTDNHQWRARILWFASYEYVRRARKIEKLNDEEMSRFIHHIVFKWKQVKNKVFKPDVHYDIYVTDRAQEPAALAYLKEKDKV